MKWLTCSAALLFCCAAVNSANAFHHHGCGCAPKAFAQPHEDASVVRGRKRMLQRRERGLWSTTRR